MTTSHDDTTAPVVEAVIFDLDGVLLDSESTWRDVRRRLVRDAGGHWYEGAERDMMGMSSTEWAKLIHDRMGIDLAPDEISSLAVKGMLESYRRRLPLLPGATRAVEQMAARWPLGLASSSNRPLIDLVLELAGLRDRFRATVSSEEVAHGKPFPDVYLEASRRLGFDAGLCAAIEDSTNGLRAAKSAGMLVVAVPNRDFPPDPSALGVADLVITSLLDLTVQAVTDLGSDNDGYGHST